MLSRKTDLCLPFPLRRLPSAGPIRDLTAAHVHLEVGAPTTTGSTSGAVGGYVVVSGDLQPGRYGLAMLAVGQVVEIVVLEPLLPATAASNAATAGTTAGGATASATAALMRGGTRLLLGSCMVAEDAEPQPLQLLHVAASARGGVRVVLGGSRSELGAASVAVTLGRFLPVGGAGRVQPVSDARDLYVRAHGDRWHRLMYTMQGALSACLWPVSLPARLGHHGTVLNSSTVLLHANMHITCVATRTSSLPRWPSWVVGACGALGAGRGTPLSGWRAVGRVAWQRASPTSEW